MDIITCQRCQTANEFHVINSGPHLKAICDNCNRYIKFLSKNTVPPGIKKEGLVIMAQSFFGSICLDDLFAGKIGKGSNGKHYVCLDDLTSPPFNKGKNGKSYVNVGSWVNDEPDQFGNTASLFLSQTKEEYAAKVKKQYIGNLKPSQAAAAAPAPVAVPAQQAALADDFPF